MPVLACAARFRGGQSAVWFAVAASGVFRDEIRQKPLADELKTRRQAHAWAEKQIKRTD